MKEGETVNHEEGKERGGEGEMERGREGKEERDFKKISIINADISCATS